MDIFNSTDDVLGPILEIVRSVPDASTMRKQDTVPKAERRKKRIQRLRRQLDVEKLIQFDGDPKAKLRDTPRSHPKKRSADLPNEEEKTRKKLKTSLSAAKVKPEKNVRSSEKKVKQIVCASSSRNKTKPRVGSATRVGSSTRVGSATKKRAGSSRAGADRKLTKSPLSSARKGKANKSLKLDPSVDICSQLIGMKRNVDGIGKKLKPTMKQKKQWESKLLDYLRERKMLRDGTKIQVDNHSIIIKKKPGGLRPISKEYVTSFLTQVLENKERLNLASVANVVERMFSTESRGRKEGQYVVKYL